MRKFSERYGYTIASEVIIREQITEPIINTTLNILSPYLTEQVVEDVKTKHLHQRSTEKSIFDIEIDFYKDNTIEPYLKDHSNTWFFKLNLIEYVISVIKLKVSKKDYTSLINGLNKNFERHNFAYRVIDNKIVEIHSKVEIDAIDEALKNDHFGVQKHLQTALQHLSAGKEAPDYRNSIKESISAVGSLCRSITGAGDLGAALSQLKKKGVSIHSGMTKGFQQLYSFTNDKDTAVRHEFLKDDYTATHADAIFMLVSCSAFINYITEINTK